MQTDLWPAVRANEKATWHCEQRPKRPKAQGLAIWMVQQSQPIVATVIILCFRGLFRASELLQLTWSNFIVSTQSVVIVIGVAKRGLEQKVVLTNRSVLSWVAAYLRVIKSDSLVDPDKVFPISYGKLQLWIKRGMSTFWFLRCVVLAWPTVWWCHRALENGI